MKRRTFLEFLGLSATSLSLTSCSSKKELISSLFSSTDDTFLTHPDLRWNTIIKWGDLINQTEFFGYNNDYLAYFPDQDDPNRRGLLWVNHEYIDPRFLHGLWQGEEKTQQMVDIERANVGGSVLRIERNMGSSEWHVVPSLENFRIDATTPIPIAWSEPIAGKTTLTGTLGNCAGGVTPWGTVLTAEENYQHYYGEQLRGEEWIPGSYGWEKFYSEHPHSYGWIVEVDIRKKTAQKIIAMGRCCHECATVQSLPDGRVVVYSGDDAMDKCLYKFISKNPGSLSEGELFVANTSEGRWISLDFNKQTILQEKFASQTEVLIYLREAAFLVGGSPLDRPEDIAIDPNGGGVFIALTNNPNKGNDFGSILKLVESEGYEGMKFSTETILTGGKETAFACPDNLAFDPRGNLWFTTDISDSKIGNSLYGFHGNNALFVVLRQGPQAGKPLRMANAPVGAELTGPYFTPDGRTLFLSVQHPGSNSRFPDELTSHWPEGGDSTPKSAVVAIRGPLLDSLSSI